LLHASGVWIPDAGSAHIPEGQILASCLEEITVVVQVPDFGANGFWSLTMCNRKHLFVPNSVKVLPETSLQQTGVAASSVFKFPRDLTLLLYFTKWNMPSL
jgi:hypothetical protein